MVGSSRVGLRTAAAGGGLAAVLSLGSAGMASAQTVSSIFNDVCVAHPSGSTGPCVANPGAAGAPFALSAAGVASVTPNNFNSVDFLSSTSGNTETDDALRRLQRRRAQGQQSEQSGLTRYADTDPRLLAAAPADEVVVGPFSAFFAARGGILDRDDTATQRGFSGNTVGGRVGADYRVTQALILGAYFGYDHEESDFNASAGNARVDNYSGIAYGSFNATEHLYFEASGGYVYNNYSTVRNGVISLTDQSNTGQAVPAPTPFTAAGKTHGNQWLGTVGAGYELPFGAATLTPYARFNYVQTQINAFTETSASVVGNQVAGTITTSLTSVLGARASYALGMSWGVLIPQVRGEYIHEFDGARQSSSRFSSDPAGATLLINDAVAHDYGKVGLSLTAVLPHGLLPYLDYEALVGDEHFSQHIFTAGMRVEF